MHFPAAKEFLKRGIHVICDKPLTATMAEAKAFEKAVAASEAIFCLTHNYTGYPMVRQARAMVAAGELGPITLMQAEYPQDWLTEPLECDRRRSRPSWRTDPKRSGAGALGDIGTHAYNLACFVAGDRGGRDRGGCAFDRRRPADRRQRPCDAALRQGRQGDAVVQPGRAGPRERAEAARSTAPKGGIEWVQADPNYLWFTPF